MSQSDSEIERNKLGQKEIDLALASRTLPDISSSSSDPKKQVEKKVEVTPKVDGPPVVVCIKAQSGPRGRRKSAAAGSLRVTA